MRAKKITVVQHFSRQILWSGKAKDLKKSIIKNWIVVEILTDPDDKRELPDINKSKVITVE